MTKHKEPATQGEQQSTRGTTPAETESRPAKRTGGEAQVDYTPLVQLMRNFMGALPTTSAQYEAKEDDRFASMEADVPDGEYRLEGADWIFKIEGKKLVQANRAAPPDYGGPDVIMVPAS